MENNEQDSWKKALDGAEAAPSEGVWAAIESDLIAAENVKMKRSVLLYQRLAAAAIGFALLAGSYSLYIRNTTSPAQQTAANPQNSVQKNPPAGLTPAVAEKTPKTPPASPEGDNDRIGERPAADVNSAVARRSDKMDNASKDRADALLQTREVTGNPSIKDDQNDAASVPRQDNNPSANIASVQREGSSKNPSTANDVSVAPTSHADPANTVSVSSELASDTGLAAMEKQRLAAAMSADSAQRAKNALAESPIRIKKPEKTVLPWEDGRSTVIVKQKENRESLWASVGAAAGVYNPGAKSSDVAQFQSTSTKSVGPAWSFGASVAGKVTDRWVVQGGVNYLNQSIGSSSANMMSSISGPPVANNNSISDYKQAYLAVAAGTSPALTSTLEFISLPVQAGYLVLDRKVGFMVNAGVSSNFFMRNSIQDQNGEMASFSTGAGEASPYRTVTWSGLMSTELSYRLAQQYRFSLVPGLRYALNSATKAGGDRPYVVDIGFRVRYNFN